MPKLGLAASSPSLVAPVVAVAHDDADAFGVAQRLLVIPPEAVLVKGHNRGAGCHTVLPESQSFKLGLSIEGLE